MKKFLFAASCLLAVLVLCKVSIAADSAPKLAPETAKPSAENSQTESDVTDMPVYVVPFGYSPYPSAGQYPAPYSSPRQAQRQARRAARQMGQYQAQPFLFPQPGFASPAPVQTLPPAVLPCPQPYPYMIQGTVPPFSGGQPNMIYSPRNFNFLSLMRAPRPYLGYDPYAAYPPYQGQVLYQAVPAE